MQRRPRNHKPLQIHQTTQSINAIYLALTFYRLRSKLRDANLGVELRIKSEFIKHFIKDLKTVYTDVCEKRIYVTLKGGLKRERN